MPLYGNSSSMKILAWLCENIDGLEATHATLQTLLWYSIIVWYSRNNSCFLAAWLPCQKMSAKKCAISRTKMQNFRNKCIGSELKDVSKTTFQSLKDLSIEVLLLMLSLLLLLLLLLLLWPCLLLLITLYLVVINECCSEANRCSQEPTCKVSSKSGQ